MQKGDAMDAAERSERIPDIVIITGMSGSGRTQAMHVFEDMGYFCIDNLPPRLIAQLAELVGINTGVGRHLAVTCDLRSQGLFDELLDAVAALEEREMSCDIVFLEASDEVLIRRYSENRRRHPIAKPGETTADAIQRERLQLQGVRDRADMIIDTSRIDAGGNMCDSRREPLAHFCLAQQAAHGFFRAVRPAAYGCPRVLVWL